MNDKNLIKITPKIRRTVKQLIRVAIDYRNVTGRNPGVTGEIGEILVSDKLNLFLVTDQINAGFDAVNSIGKKYQIKTRLIIGGKIKGRLSTVSKHKFDFAVLAILNEGYQIIEMYKIGYKKLSQLAEKYKRRNPPVKEFIKNAKKLGE
ncbi:hypothetical protein A2108_01945 [Candidatus Wolfebacteria bacterium GWA1_42_9]|uniref:Uncharacterized protein n=2 Tax=Patescibacteria group TaxID=1783273 RepID=A0A1F8DKI3_9BACT|nr:MAG: hypothetical protein A2108_01945 [Candidatus Wolfebacteria bacterium GWA1_42_9]